MILQHRVASSKRVLSFCRGSRINGQRWRPRFNSRGSIRPGRSGVSTDNHTVAREDQEVADACHGGGTASQFVVGEDLREKGPENNRRVVNAVVGIAEQRIVPPEDAFDLDGRQYASQRQPFSMRKERVMSWKSAFCRWGRIDRMVMKKPSLALLSRQAKEGPNNITAKAGTIQPQSTNGSVSTRNDAFRQLSVCAK